MQMQDAAIAGQIDQQHRRVARQTQHGAIMAVRVQQLLIRGQRLLLLVQLPVLHLGQPHVQRRVSALQRGLHRAVRITGIGIQTKLLTMLAPRI